MSYFLHLFSEEPIIVRRRAGEMLFRDGDEGGHMYVLTSGNAEILVGSHVVEPAGPGTIVGELAIIDSGPRAASVRACSDCEFVQIDRDRFDHLVAKTPEFARRVMHVMAERLRKTNAMLEAN